MEDFDIFQDDDFSEDAEVFEDDQPSGIEDDFNMDNLRRQSARSGSTFEEMDTTADDDSFDDFDVADEGESKSGFSLSNFTPGQRLILAILVLLDIVAVLFGVLVVTGRFSL